MKILAVDYGASRTGLAVCDPTEFLTTPITPQITLKARPKVAAEVCRIAQEQKAELIVVGLPLNMDGTKGIRVERTEAFAEELSKAFPDIPYHFWDERLTTVMAQKQLIAADVSRRKRKKVIDKMAAVAILEGYLQHLSFKNRG